MMSPRVHGVSFYRLVMQSNDGNLVEYVLKSDHKWHALWDTQTDGNPGASAQIQGNDGNFVVYSSSHHPLWAAWGLLPHQPAPNYPNDRLCLQTDGNLVIYAANSNTAVWTTDTYIRRKWGTTRTTRNTGYPVGECTYWADTQFHGWTGKWIAWTGNANQWPSNAQAIGWSVGAAPRAGSIVEYEPGHYGAGSVGHVAWVLDYYPNLGKVLVSEMNFDGFNVVDYRQVTAVDSANIHYIYVNPAP